MQKRVIDYDFVERLHYYKRKKKMTAAKLSELSGVPRRTIEKILGGGSPNPQFFSLAALIDALGLSLDAFFEQDGMDDHDRKMVAKYQQLDPSEKVLADGLIDGLLQLKNRDGHENLIAKPIKHEIRLPFYFTAVSAGTGNFLDGEFSEIRQYPEALVPEGATFTMPVTGDSMKPAFQAGDTVFVQGTDSVETGDVCIVVINGESYIKQYREQTFFSFNPAYKTIVPGEFDQVNIIGRVLNSIPAGQ